MKTEQVAPKVKRHLKVRWPVMIISLVIIGLLAGGVYYLKKSKDTGSTIDISSQRTANAAKGNISTTVTGSGPISSANEVNVSLKVGGTVTKVYIKAGQKVKAGGPICDLDTKDMVTSIQNSQDELDQTKLTQQQNMSDLKKLNVTAPFNGQIANISVNEGDVIGKNGMLFTIVDSKNMKLLVPFSGNDKRSVRVGDVANVNIQNLMQSIKGRVTYVGNAPYANQTGSQMYNIEITIKNPGTLTEGMKASADINTKQGIVSSTDAGSLNYANKFTIKSDTGGTIEKIYTRQYQDVKAGEVLAKLQNSDLINSINSTKLKINSLQEQLNTAKEQLSYYKVTSPISGVVSAVNVKEGDSLKGAEIVSTILDDSHYQFQISVDELDIAKVQAGQKVNVTVDALSQTSTLPLSGTVSDIAVEGTSSNGVTTYPVTITIKDTADITDMSAIRSMLRNSNGTGNWIRGNNSGGNGNGNQSGGSGNSGYGGGNWTRGNGNTANGTGTQGNFSFGGNLNRNGSNGNGMNSGNGGGFGGQNMMNRINEMVKSAFKGLRAGMNADAEIMISSKTNVLTVPLESIFKSGGKNYVMVKSDEKTVQQLKDSGKYVDILSSRNRIGRSSGANGTNSGSTNNNQTGQNNSTRSQTGQSGTSSRNRNSSTNQAYLKQLEKYYANAIPTEVELGANDESNIEIVSGLKEGQSVILPPLVQSTTSSQQGTQGMMFGGLGGGAFGGNNNRNNSGNSYRNNNSSSSTRNSNSSGGNGGGN